MIGGGRAASALEFAGPLPPARFNMADYAIGRAARATPDKIALVVIDDVTTAEPLETWTFAALDAAVLAVAADLRARGLSPGDRLVIALDNTSSYAILYFAAIAAGFVPVPTSTQLTAAELHFVIEDSDASLIALAENRKNDPVASARPVVRDADIRKAIATSANNSSRHIAYADMSADDPAYLIYTSGTTAQPKGVLHAHRAAWGRRPMYEDWYAISSADRMLHAGAFNWTYTLGTGLTDPWANGATSYIYTGAPAADIWPKLIEATGATLFAAVPGVYRQMLKYAALTPDRMPTLRHALMAGEAPPKGVFDAWQATTGRLIYEALGMSEISTFISTAPGTPRRCGATGRPQRGRAVAILADVDSIEPIALGEPGLIAIHRSDPGLMLGYWRRPQEEAAVFRGDWFVGGDRGVMHPDGAITHLGRANDLMKALGYRVAPQEVEAAISTLPGVAAVACAEVAVRADVSVIGAFVVCDGSVALDQQAIIDHAAHTLAAYKVPRAVVFLDDLPRTPNGKVRRASLAALFADGAALSSDATVSAVQNSANAEAPDSGT